jgi:hypothetical protein
LEGPETLSELFDAVEERRLHPEDVRSVCDTLPECAAVNGKEGGGPNPDIVEVPKQEVVRDRLRIAFKDRILFGLRGFRFFLFLTVFQQRQRIGKLVRRQQIHQCAKATILVLKLLVRTDGAQPVSLRLPDVIFPQRIKYQFLVLAIIPIDWEAALPRMVVGN